MRNLKRALSLALASIMVLGLMVVGASAASYNDFTDKDEIKNSEAVNTMVSLGVISGKDDGSYDPTGSLTRAEACTLIARMLGGGKDPILGSNIKSNFKDTQGHWAENYIAYCANLGIIAGVGNGYFKPNDTLTGSAAAKMVLCALGYKPEFEGIGGANWELATNTLATKVKLYEGLDNLNPSATISRDDVAQLIYNGVQAQEVEYRNLQGDYSGTLYATEKGTMLANRFEVVKVEGVVVANEVFGINGNGATLAGKTQLDDTNTYGEGGKNNYNGVYPISMSNDLVGQRVVIYVKFQNALSPNAASSTVVGNPIVSDKTTVVETSSRLKDTDAVKDALKGTGISMPSDGTAKSNLYTEGKSVAGTSNGVQEIPGVRQRFIDNTGDGKVDLIMQEKAALSKVSVYNEKDEKLTLSSIGSIDFDDIVGYKDVAKDDYVLVTKYDDTYVVTKAETVEGKVTAYNNSTPATITVDGTKYAVGAGADKTTDLDGKTELAKLSDMVDNSYRLYLDAAGNVLSVKVIDEAIGNYAVITGCTGDPKEGFSSGKVKLTMADGTTGTYDVDLLASAKKWNSTTDGKDLSNSKKEAEMAKVLADQKTVNTLVTYTVSEDGTVILGQPDYINSKKYDTAEQTIAITLNSNTASYKFNDGKTVVMDNSTVFFIDDANGYSVVVGLNKLPSKGVEAQKVNAIFDYSGNTKVATAVYMKLDTAFASTSNYFFITGNYSMSTEDGTTVYSYPVVFTDGTTGTIKTKDSATYAKNVVYSYKTDSKGYATDIKAADGYTVNNAFVYETGNNTVSLWNADNYGEKMGTYTLASDVKVWNVEDTDNVYDTTLAKASVVSIVLNDDGAVKYAFVRDVRDSADEESMTKDVDMKNIENGKSTLTYTYDKNQEVSVSVNGGKAVKGVEGTVTLGSALESGDQVVVTISQKDMVSRVLTYTVK